MTLLELHKKLGELIEIQGAHGDDCKDVPVFVEIGNQSYDLENIIPDYYNREVCGVSFQFNKGE